MYDEWSGSPDSEPVGNYGGGIGGAAGLVAVGAGLYDSWRNRAVSKENTNKTIAAQKSESELAYQRSVEMYNAQNMYNSPQAQMQRFTEAGLNPHLIYGQGSPGNASSPPQYAPADLQYRYEAPRYGAAIQSLLPTLMAVGTWMQNMRSSEIGIQKSMTETERARQLIDYLEEKNPKELELLRQKSDVMYPFQAQLLHSQNEIARTKLHELSQEFKYKYGEDLWNQSGIPGGAGGLGGLRRLQFLEESSKEKLLSAKASMTDFNITDPQALMQLVLSGVMGLAGQTIRMSNRPKVVPKRERPKGLSFNRMSRHHPDRR